MILFLLCQLLVLPVAAKEKAAQVVAHRGCWKADHSAQNSIRALELANEMKVYGAEFDVHLTADNIPVVFHDSEIQGIPIQTSLYADIKELKLPNGERLPTLEEYLEKGKGLPHIKLIFELKSHATPERNREAAQISVGMVNRFGLQDRTEYITFDLEAGKELIRLTSGVPVAYLNGDLAPERLYELGFSGLDYPYTTMKEHPEWFAEAREYHLTVNVWTVNDPEQIREMIMQGADYITTDEPSLALDVAGVVVD
jgi:glycerophosphoryl diester phosphodiesterase